MTYWADVMLSNPVTLTVGVIMVPVAMLLRTGMVKPTWAESKDAESSHWLANITRNQIDMNNN